jgi:hypothetical protein
MKIASLLIFASLFAYKPASAQVTLDIGGQTDISLEHIPSVGDFVQGYINGHGPFWFEINLSSPTQLTPALIKAVGLKLKPNSVFINDAGVFEEEPKTDDIDIHLGDATIKASPIAIPDRDLNAYAPIKNYGGSIGAEILQNNVLTIDTAQKRLTLAPHQAYIPAIGEHSSPISMIDRRNSFSDNTSILAPTIDITIDGQKYSFYFSTRIGPITFYHRSENGNLAFDKTSHRYKTLNWSPDGVVDGEGGTSIDVAIGDAPLWAHSIYRDMSPLSLYRQTGLNEKSLLNEKSFFKHTTERHLENRPNDGIVSFTSLGSPSITLDSVSERAWFQAPSGDPAKNHVPAKLEASSTIGFIPWPYRDRVIVRRLVLGSPADLAGLRPGDEILSLNDGDIYQYYKNLDLSHGDQPTKVVFRNHSGQHTVLLAPATPKG